MRKLSILRNRAYLECVATQPPAKRLHLFVVGPSLAQTLFAMLQFAPRAGAKSKPACHDIRRHGDPDVIVWRGPGPLRHECRCGYHDVADSHILRPSAASFTGCHDGPFRNRFQTMAKDGLLSPRCASTKHCRSAHRIVVWISIGGGLNATLLGRSKAPMLGLSGRVLPSKSSVTLETDVPLPIRIESLLKW